MKNRWLVIKFVLVTILISMSFISCATSASAAKSGTKEEVSSPDDFSGPAFEDWRYKFFGQELPVWFFYAYDSDFEGVINSRDDLSGVLPENLGMILGNAVNGDQAEQFISQNVQVLGERVIDSFWAKLSEDEESTQSYRWLILLKMGE